MRRATRSAPARAPSTRRRRIVVLRQSTRWWLRRSRTWTVASASIRRSSGAVPTLIALAQRTFFCASSLHVGPTSAVRARNGRASRPMAKHLLLGLFEASGTRRPCFTDCGPKRPHWRGRSARYRHGCWPSGSGRPAASTPLASRDAGLSLPPESEGRSFDFSTASALPWTS